ncbi:MAG TPA: hypothetical protein VGB00_14025 [Pyrinomonadaceae bacterium]|jgi:hypothetical protein
MGRHFPARIKISGMFTGRLPGTRICFSNVGDDFQQIAAGNEKDVIIFDEARHEEWLKITVK